VIEKTSRVTHNLTHCRDPKLKMMSPAAVWGRLANGRSGGPCLTEHVLSSCEDVDVGGLMGGTERSPRERVPFGLGQDVWR
jgi:hypothetical protein